MIFRENLFGCRTQRVQKPKEVISKCKHDLHLMSTELLDLRILRLKDGLELIFTESVQHFNCGEWFTDWKWMSTWAKYSEPKKTWWILPHWLVSLNSGAKTLS